MTAAEPHRVDDASYEDSARHWHAEVVRLRAKEKLLRDSVRLLTTTLSNSNFDEATALPWLPALLTRIAEAEAKHPRDDWKDGTGCLWENCSEPHVLHTLDRHAPRFLDLRKHRVVSAESEGTVDWLQILLCEVHELACETSDERIMDELLDVATICVRWFGAKMRKVAR